MSYNYMKSDRDNWQDKFFALDDKYKALQAQHEDLQAKYRAATQPPPPAKPKDEEKKNPCYLVEVWECERGWGPRVDDTHKFETEAEAKKFVMTYNANNEPAVNGVAPDWYMQAKYIGRC